MSAFAEVVGNGPSSDVRTQDGAHGKRRVEDRLSTGIGEVVRGARHLREVVLIGEQPKRVIAAQGDSLLLVEAEGYAGAVEFGGKRYGHRGWWTPVRRQ